MATQKWALERSISQLLGDVVCRCDRCLSTLRLVAIALQIRVHSLATLRSLPTGKGPSIPRVRFLSRDPSKGRPQLRALSRSSPGTGEDAALGFISSAIYIPKKTPLSMTFAEATAVILGSRTDEWSRLDLWRRNSPTSSSSKQHGSDHTTPQHVSNASHHCCDTKFETQTQDKGWTGRLSKRQGKKMRGTTVVWSDMPGVADGWPMPAAG